MSESIPDVILRLARRHLPVDAAMPVSPARPDSEPSEMPIDGPALSPRDPNAATIVEHVPAASNSSSTATEAVRSKSLEIAGVGPNAHMEMVDILPQVVVQASRLPSAGGTPAPQPATTPHADEPYQSTSTTELLAADSGPAWGSPHTQTATFTPGSDPSYRPGNPADDFADDSFEPITQSATNAGSSRDQSPVNAVDEASRQLEQTARDLETSLTHLFSTQIETLQRLRDRVDEQERRWVEQQGARRATL